jgi:very-short-patch-repair endonuclease
MLPYDKRLREPSRRLREAMTAAEQFLWSKIRMKQVSGYWFYRQKPVGEYIADFYCPKAKLVIEVDGGKHLSRENREYDKVRDKYMEGLGLRILRFTNIEILTNIKGVLKRINDKISLNPSLRKSERIV